MVANMTSAQLSQWNNNFLIDLGVKSNQYAADLPFLQAWENRENVGNLATFNPLATTMPGYGGHPVPGQSAGVMAYPDISSGAAANAQVLMGSNPGYAQLLQGFQQGTLNPNATYQGLQTWSGPGGYSSLTGIDTGLAAGSTNNSGVTAGQIQSQGTQAQIGISQALEHDDEAYARSEAAFQQQLLGLQKQGLANSEATLARQLAEAPIFQAEVEKQFGLQKAGIAASGQDVNRQYRQQLIDMTASGAGSGGLFTKGERDSHANTMADWASATASLQRQKEALLSKQHEEEVQYMESIANFQDQQKSLALLGQKYGISGAEIASKLGYSLKQLQDGMALDVANLYTQLMTGLAGTPGNYQAVPITDLTTQNPFQPGAVS